MAEQDASGQDAGRHGVDGICAAFGNDRHRMLDILSEVQRGAGWISPGALDRIAAATGLTRVAVEGVASFYSFFSLQPRAPLVIRLCDDIIDRFAGMAAVEAAFAAELADAPGIALERTACIGLCDHAPAAMIGAQVVGALTPDRARAIARALKAGATPAEALGLAGSALDMARAQAPSLIRVAGPLLEATSGLARARGMTPAEILDEIEASGLRGCGGAGFATARKWRMAAAAPDPERWVFCNADEGEPGTFKDRVLLTERPDLVFDGMEIAARAIGAAQGLIYLRGEYEYLLPHLMSVLAARGGLPIRIQLGAGAYVCGEEGALISSAEGLPGEPKTRPPFPVTRGYLGHPTVVNNVETLAHVAQILAQGAAEFRAQGTEASPGTRLYSVAGDCARPGIYELPQGGTLADLLARAGAEGAAAVQVGGPSGTLVGRDGFGRRLCFEDLATGGAVTIFGPDRNLIEILQAYIGFFAHESCGFCTPCRVGTVMLQKAMSRLAKGHAGPEDIVELKELAATMQETSRCGLGVSAPNPVLTALKNFPLVFAALTRPAPEGVKASFDIQSAIDRARGIAHRRSTLFDRDFSA